MRKYPTRFAVASFPDIDVTPAWMLGTMPFQDNAKYRSHACFTPKRGRYQLGSSTNYVTFESRNEPGRYVYYVREGYVFATWRDDLSDGFA